MIAPDLNAITVFVKVVELKNFRAAASALGIPKSTISLKVAQLEDRLGARLLERTTRTLRLTDAGSAYYRQVTPALDALHEAERAVDDVQALPSGRLRVTTTYEGGQFLLGPVFAEYLRRYPAVQMQIDLSDRHVDLVEEGFDLAIRLGTLPDSTLIARRLTPQGPLRAYASPSYLRHRGRPRRPEELTEHDCLVMSSHRYPNVWTFHVKRKIVPVTVRARAEANSFRVLCDLATAGVGITRLPEYIAAGPIAAGQLRLVLDEFSPPPIAWTAIYPSARHLSSKVRALIELLEERLAANAGDTPAA